jgi:rubredoxin
MNTWKCEQCGYQFKDEVPPEECPACHVKCSFLDVTVYTPDHKHEGADHRIKPKPDSAPIHK